MPKGAYANKKGTSMILHKESEGFNAHFSLILLSKLFFIMVRTIIFESLRYMHIKSDAYHPCYYISFHYELNIQFGLLSISAS